MTSQAGLKNVYRVFCPCLLATWIHALFFVVTRPVMLNMSLHHFCLYCPKPILVALMLPLIRSKCKCTVQFTQRSQVSEVVWCCYTLSCVAPSHWLHAVNVSKEVCRSPIWHVCSHGNLQWDNFSPRHHNSAFSKHRRTRFDSLRLACSCLCLSNVRSSVIWAHVTDGYLQFPCNMTVKPVCLRRKQA